MRVCCSNRNENEVRMCACDARATERVNHPNERWLTYFNICKTVKKRMFTVEWNHRMILIFFPLREARCANAWQSLFSVLLFSFFFRFLIQ